MPGGGRRVEAHHLCSVADFSDFRQRPRMRSEAFHALGEGENVRTHLFRP